LTCGSCPHPPVEVASPSQVQLHTCVYAQADICIGLHFLLGTRTSRFQHCKKAGCTAALSLLLVQLHVNKARDALLPQLGLDGWNVRGVQAKVIRQLHHLVMVPAWQVPPAHTAIAQLRMMPAGGRGEGACVRVPQTL
jgi:hypothetical protein